MNIKPYPFQRRVAQLLLNGLNVILQAPTGAGKTRAAMLPFLAGLENNHNFPRKCLYSVPMRVLANQFFKDYRPLVTRAGRGKQIQVEIQTGERTEDRELSATLTFATVDQTLSSFLLAPYSLPRRQANLNAGAVIASYLVFDEFHLYDPISTLPTTLHMLQMLKGITPFVLMTATFSADMLCELGELLGAEIVPNSPEERCELQNLESQQKTRRYWVENQPLSARNVLDKHAGRSLVICNTVDRARRLYEALVQNKDAQTEVLLLYSRFLQPDRDRIEEYIRARFAREASGESLIVVSTQAIEVGVDITSTALHTELAPANSILQRAGRCARYPGETGDVYIYSRTTDARTGDEIDLMEHLAPYMNQRDEFTATLAQFQARQGTSLNFGDEQTLITAVHGKRDRDIIQQLRMDAPEHRRNMHAVMRGQNDAAPAQSLIREVFQQRVTIHANPEELLASPFDAPSFGLHPGTLQGYVSAWLDQFHDDDNIPWAVKWLKQRTDPDAEQSNRSFYEWIEVYDNPREVFGAPLVVVHPRLATYDSVLGFIPNRGGDWQTMLPESDKRNERPLSTYRLETYEDHIRQVYKAAFEHPGFWREVEHTAHMLEQRFNLKPGSVRRATELAVLLHDVGKLSTGWQKWVQDYQASIGQPVKAGTAYAHTELRDDSHREAEKRMKKRPWHAVEGAIATAQIVLDEFGEGHPLTYAVFSAIARHHTPVSDSNQSFKLVKAAVQHIRSAGGDGVTISTLIGETEKVDTNFGASVLIAEPDNWPGYLAYLLIVRVLRRADQLGTSRGAKGI